MFPPGRRALAPVLAVVAAAVAACGGGSTATPGPAIAESSSTVHAGGPAGRYDAVHTGICLADGAAAAGDPTGTRAAFANAHQGLHDVADEAAKTDRAASARLLETKQRVEADLQTPGTPVATTKADLDALLPPLRAAAAATGNPMPASCS